MSSRITTRKLFYLRETKELPLMSNLFALDAMSLPYYFPESTFARKAKRSNVPALNRVRFCPVDRPERMMRRGVDRIQLEGAISRVDEVVPGPRREDDGRLTVDPLPTVQLGTTAACQGYAAAAFHADSPPFKNRYA